MSAPSPDNRPWNAMTVDVEDYFQVSVMETVAPRERWDSHESRVTESTRAVLDLLGEANVTATFFILGWVAERHPQLVRRIADAGHEIASHSYWHRLVYSMTPVTFREDLRRAKDVIESAAGCAVRGFRAPSYSIVTRSLWALDVLIEEGYTYDASIFPIRHDRYGIPSWPHDARPIVRESGSLLEIPGTAGRWGSLSVPIGGGYFRLLPYAVTRRAIRRVNVAGKQPAVFYIHPWEFDPDQPALPVMGLSRVRHYRNLTHTADRFRRLLREFRFGPIQSVFDVRPAAHDAAAAS
jgi:polysaccharide deacetylase family protein (PEP-CTERM system associated)